MGGGWGIFGNLGVVGPFISPGGPLSLNIISNTPVMFVSSFNVIDAGKKVGFVYLCC